MTMRLDPYPMKRRVVLWVCAVLVACLGLPAWLFYQRLSDQIMEQVKRESLLQLRFVGELYEKAGDFDTVDRLQDWVSHIGTSLGSRITILDASGRVIADSEIPANQIPLLEHFANRPEILQLQHEEVGILFRSSQLMLKEYMCVATRVKTKGKAAGAYLRLAVPGSHIGDVLGQVRQAFLLLILVGAGGAALTGYFVVRRGVRVQTQLLTQSIRELASGQVEGRLHAAPEDELHPLIEAINEMADRIQKHVRSVSDQKRQWEAIFDGMEEGVLILDSKGRIQQHNKALTRLTRRSDQCIGKRPLEVILNNELQSVCDQVLNPSDPSGAAEPRRLSITLGNDHTYDVTVVRSKLLDGRAGAILVFHDLTELRRLERVRQDFVANVSHELRTPLTSVKGYVETLIDDGSLDRETASAFLRIIKNNTDHMVKIVDDLLQLARLQARDSSTQRAPMDASKALTTAWKACEALAKAKEVHLVSHLAPEGVMVLADPDRMVQVFRNLLENAIRYSPEGADIMVECATHNEGCLFSIRDDGPGIPWQHQQRVFERFYRVEKDRSSRFGSTGLGLAICRHIIINHGGRIWVQSPNPGKLNGTTVFFTLECPRDPGTRLRPAPGDLSSN